MGRIIGQSVQESVSNNRIEKIYIASAQTAIEAKNVVLNNAPANLNGMPLVRHDIEVETINESTYKCTLPYELKDSIEEKELVSTFKIRTTGQTTHFLKSLETTKQESLPDHKNIELQGMVGVNGNEITGYDRLTSTFTWDEVHYIQASKVDDTFINNIFLTSSSVSSSTFRGFAVGEVLCLDAQVEPVGNQKHFRLDLTFSATPNTTHIFNGKSITKKGWHYLWYMFQRTEHNDAKTLLPTAIRMFIERIYEERPYTNLQIPAGSFKTTFPHLWGK